MEQYKMIVSGDFSQLYQYSDRAGIYGISGVYQAKGYNPLYIGSAVNVERRIQEHFRDLRYGEHSNPFLQNAFNNHQDDFVVLFFEDCKRENTLKLEQEYLDYWKPFNDCSGGFNIAKNAKSPFKGKTHTKESRMKMSKKVKGRKLSEEHKKNLSRAADRRRDKGIKPHSEEHKRKLSLANKGKKHSEESRMKMSIANKGRIVSEETRRKLSLARIGKKHSLETRQRISDGLKCV